MIKLNLLLTCLGVVLILKSSHEDNIENILPENLSSIIDRNGIDFSGMELLNRTDYNPQFETSNCEFDKISLNTDEPIFVLTDMNCIKKGCAYFKYSVVVNVSETNYTGILTLRPCLSMEDCRSISCSAARASHDFQLLSPHSNSSFIEIGDKCNRSCCDENNTCIEITSSFGTTSSPNAKGASTFLMQSLTTNEMVETAASTASTSNRMTIKQEYSTSPGGGTAQTVVINVFMTFIMVAIAMSFHYV